MPRSSFLKGGVSVAIFRKDDHWYIDYYINGVRRREKIGSTREPAQTVLAKTKVAIAEGRFLEVFKQPRLNFGELASQYFQFSVTNKRSWRRYIGSTKHLKSVFGGRCVCDTTSLMVEHYKARRKDETSRATVNRELACLKHMFTKAIEWGCAADNPAKKVKFLREDNQRLRYLTPAEMRDLLMLAALI